MKNAFALLALGFMVMGSVACSSAPKEAESAPMPEAVTQAEPTIAPEAPQAPQKAPQADLSLGAGSSGRGH